MARTNRRAQRVSFRRPVRTTNENIIGFCFDPIVTYRNTAAPGQTNKTHSEIGSVERFRGNQDKRMTLTTIPAELWFYPRNDSNRQ